jgi:hypothetical protein
MAGSLHEYKMRFAALLQRFPREDRLQRVASVIKEVVGKDVAAQYPVFVLKISDEWPFDEEVLAEIDRLDLIPKSKELILSHVYSIAMDKYTEKKDKLFALKLYGEMNGWIKPKEIGTPNEVLIKLQALHNATTNPVDT